MTADDKKTAPIDLHLHTLMKNTEDIKHLTEQLDQLTIEFVQFKSDGAKASRAGKILAEEFVRAQTVGTIVEDQVVIATHDFHMRLKAIEQGLDEYFQAKMLSYLGTDVITAIGITHDKGGILQRIASCEQRLNGLRTISPELRKDGKFLDDYRMRNERNEKMFDFINERFGEFDKRHKDMKTFEQAILDSLNKKPWWKFW